MPPGGRRDLPARLAPLVLVLEPALLLGFAIYSSTRFAWLCDDAFISFRYARNLSLGRGLVFNAGERVEGFTNLLWTLLLSGGMAAGVEPESFSMVAGILFMTLTLLLVYVTALRLFRRPGTYAVSLATAGLAAHRHFAIFATSGLETAMFTFLCTATICTALLATRPRHYYLLGFAGTLASLTRPEGLLFYGFALLFCLWNQEDGAMKRLGAALLPGILLLVPVCIWKIIYYGSIVPNTFYAKASHGPGWQQGAFYVLLYFRSYWPLVLALLSLVVMAAIPRPSSVVNRSNQPASLLILFTSTTYLLYVARVGGDFMFARFCIPITPLLLLGLEMALTSLPPRRSSTLLSWLIPLGIYLFPYPEGLLYRGQDQNGIRGIVEERDWYPPEWISEARRQGQVLNPVLAGSDVRSEFVGAQAMLVYYSDLPYALESVAGLTDLQVARMPPPADSRVGHGKKTDLDYLRSRDIHLSFDFRQVRQVPPLVAIDFGEGVTGRIISYDARIMRLLRERGARFVEFEEFLDRYIEEMEQMSTGKIRREYAGFKTYYFQHTPDPARQSPFLERLKIHPREQ